MLFTCKNLMFSDLVWKKIFALRNGWGLAPPNFIKETLLKKTLTPVLSCEICKLFKRNDFEEHLPTSASKFYLKRDSNTGFFCQFCEWFKNT